MVKNVIENNKKKDIMNKKKGVAKYGKSIS